MSTIFKFKYFFQGKCKEIKFYQKNEVALWQLPIGFLIKIAALGFNESSRSKL